METAQSIRFDHFAYPVDDLVRAEEFYTGVFQSTSGAVFA